MLDAAGAPVMLPPRAQGTGARYIHLRPEYLHEFIASTEAFWQAGGGFTDAHLRYQRDTKSRFDGHLSGLGDTTKT